MTNSNCIFPFPLKNRINQHKSQYYNQIKTVSNQYFLSNYHSVKRWAVSTDLINLILRTADLWQVGNTSWSQLINLVTAEQVISCWPGRLSISFSYRKISQNVLVYNQLLILLDGNTQTPLFMGPQSEVLKFIQIPLRHVLILVRVRFYLQLSPSLIQKSYPFRPPSFILWTVHLLSLRPSSFIPLDRSISSL